MKKRIAMSIGCLTCVVTTVFFSGCKSSEPEWFDQPAPEFSGKYENLERIVPERCGGLAISTSEINKALCGESAKAFVLVKGEIVLSNANDRVSGFKGISTGKDFACALTNAYATIFGFLGDESYTRKGVKEVSTLLGFGPTVRRPISETTVVHKAFANFILEDQNLDRPRIPLETDDGCGLEDRNSNHPILKMEVRFPTAIRIDSEGALRVIYDFEGFGSCTSETAEGGDSRRTGYSSAIKGADSILSALKIVNGSDETTSQVYNSMKRLLSRPRCWGQLVDKEFKEGHAYLVIHGDDDESVLAVGKDIKYKDKYVKDWRRWVERGDEFVIMGTNKSSAMGVRFFKKRRWWWLWLF